MYKVEVKIKAKPGDEVLVLNYRKRPHAWEYGIVNRSKVGINEDLKTIVSYHVNTVRTVNNKWGVPHPIRLYVNDDQIQIVNP